ncbi:helix-turn-helix domain-containing protein [Candidatus Bathyarchaeota archaeon]|nr:helix-turn-helix domain-containing protein [Candidatus Bathyarchaeota archaeon]
MNFAFCRNSVVSLLFQAMDLMTGTVNVDHAVKMRVYPNVAQVELLAKLLGCKRLIWNQWLEDWTARENESFEKNEMSPSSIHLPRESHSPGDRARRNHWTR